MTRHEQEAATYLQMQMRARNASDPNLYEDNFTFNSPSFSTSHTHTLSLPDCETHLITHESSDERPGVN